MNTLLVVVRFAHLLAALLLFGSFVFAVVVAPQAMRADAHGNALEWNRLLRRLRTIARWSLALGVVSAAVWFALEVALVSGLPLADAMTGDTLGRVATQTEFGRAWLWRFAIALALVVVLVYDARSAASSPGRTQIAGTLLAGCYLAMLAYAGHAAAGQGDDRYVRIGADAAHLLAAGAWLGALPGLVLLLAGVRRTAAVASIDVAASAVRRFSALGISSVSVLIASGVVNSWFLVGDVPHLIGTEYGRLLMIKVALFLAMLTLASINRVRLTPRIVGRDFVALRKLSYNAALETALGIVVVAIVSALGVTVPAAHQEPIWLLSFTLHAAPVETAAAAGWLVAMIVTSLCVVGALALAERRRERASAWRSAIAGVVVLIGAALTCPYVSVAPAYPTTYAVSPARYTTQAIAQGAALYAENCAQCHGLHGRGDGPLATSLTNRPADLILHSMHHSTGDMFWWISHGIAGTAMPAFGTRLPDASIWSLIEFLRAQSVANDAIELTQRIEPWRPIVAPDFTFELAAHAQESLKAERGRHSVLLVLYTLPQSLERLQSLAADEARAAKSGLRVIAVPIRVAAQTAEAAPSGTQSIAALADPDVGMVYAMFAATESSASRSSAPVHAEFLIDRQGYLRARWLGVPDDAMKQTTAIVDQAAALNEEPPHEMAPEAHVH